MSCGYVQFPDLTEVASSFYYSEVSREALEKEKTQFQFFTTGPACGGGSDKSEFYSQFGFRALRRMQNWWPTHSSEIRPMTFWWRKNPVVQDAPEPAARIRWCQSDNFYTTVQRAKWQKRHFDWMQKTGCGFKIGEPPLKRAYFHQYFTLLRMPVVLRPFQRLWLMQSNFSYLDQSAFAQYWINGWPVEEYTWEKEREFFTDFSTMNGYEPMADMIARKG